MQRAALITLVALVIAAAPAAVADTRTIAGWVVDLAGDPCPGLPVALVSDATASEWESITDDDGAPAKLKARHARRGAGVRVG